MGCFHRILCALALASGLLVYFPAVLSAQGSSSSEAKDTLYDQQRRGEFVYIKNCALCHLRDSAAPANTPVGGKEGAGIFGPELRGIFKDPDIHEDMVRRIITRGIPTMMPGFQYTLDAKEIDDLIAFFKVPFPPQANTSK